MTSVVVFLPRISSLVSMFGRVIRNTFDSGQILSLLVLRLLDDLSRLLCLDILAELAVQLVDGSFNFEQVG